MKTTPMPEYKWRLYCKFQNQNQFKPVDWSRGEQCTNLIYASVFTDEDRSKLEKIDIPANPDIQFEFRAI